SSDLVSLKKLRRGDYSWGSIKLVLGWVIDSVNFEIHLPHHRVECLAEVLASIPPTQRHTSTERGHKVLGELESMSIALAGARNLFSATQKGLSEKSGS
ncbi:hypothetical protein ACHAWF_000322, partial [Thalassiosira exigua]